VNAVNEISQKQISDYIKLLVEFGGVYTVDSEFFIHGPKDEIVQISLNKKHVPVKIFNDRMMTGDWVFLNPFKETMTVSTERNWFWQSRSLILGYVFKKMLETLVEKLQAKEDALHIGELDLAQQLVTHIDDKTMPALAHLSAEDYGVIFYHKKSKTAQFQCPVLDPVHHETFKSKLRKKDWLVVTTFMETILQTNEPEKVYLGTGTIICAMEAEAILTVLTKLTEAIDPYASAILGMQFPVLDMQQHLALLDKYCKLTMWHQPTAKVKATMLGTKLPWEVQDVPESVKMPGAQRNALIDTGMAANRGIRMGSQLLPSIAPPPEVKPLVLGGSLNQPIQLRPDFGIGGPPMITQMAQIAPPVQIGAVFPNSFGR